MMSFEEKTERTVNFLHDAILKIQQAMTLLKFAKSSGTLNGVERRIIDSIYVNLVEEIERIYAVEQAQRISIK